MTFEAKVSLPPESSITSDFMADIWQGNAPVSKTDVKIVV